MVETGGNGGGDDPIVPPEALDTAVTLSNGRCTLRSSTALTSGEHILAIRDGDTFVGEILESFTINPKVISDLSISGLHMVSKGYQIPISVNLNVNDEDLSGYDVQLTGAIEGNYRTDSLGKVQVNYMGKGAGDTSITATAGNQTQTWTIEDLLMYWNAASGSQNLTYSVLDGTFASQNAGFALTTDATYGIGVVGMLDGSYNANAPNYSISFDVLSSSHLKFGMTTWSATEILGLRRPTHYEDDVIYYAKDFNLQAGDNMVIEYEGTGDIRNVSYYVNGIKQHTSSVGSAYYSPAIYILGSGTLLFSNLKCKVL